MLPCRISSKPHFNLDGVRDHRLIAGKDLLANLEASEKYVVQHQGANGACNLQLWEGKNLCKKSATG